MAKGRVTRTLRPDQRKALHTLRMEKRWSYQQLKLALAAPCKAEVLTRAIDGLPIWDLNHHFLVSWLERHLSIPATLTPPRDYKQAAANDTEPPENSEAEEAPEAQEEQAEAPATSAPVRRGSR